MLENKSTFSRFVLSALLILLPISLFLLPKAVKAFMPLMYTPPTQVTLSMYRLIPPGGHNTGIRCSAGDTNYGCTADPNNSYPFGSNNTPTISIEDGTQCYLRNVVPNEMNAGHAFSTVKAQAIAARTYVYYQIKKYPNSMNNSNNRQVYIPYTYATLSSAHQTIINQALAGTPYMSEANDGANNPIAAHFSDKTGYWTDPGNEPYLKSVYDPISDGVDNPTHEYGGMGQISAAKWGAGRTAQYPGQGAPWSVRWDTPEQILAHYYTDIKFVNYDPNLSNDYRFNILNIQGLPEEIRLKPGESIRGLNIDTQNSGVFYWPVVSISPGSSCPTSGHPTRLSYHLYTADGNTLACEANRGVNSACFAIERFGLCQYNMGQANSDKIMEGENIHLGDTFIRIPSQVSPGTYKLRYDLEIVGTEWASGLPSARYWPTQDITVIVESSSSGSQGSVQINHPPAVYTTEKWLSANQKFGFDWIPSEGQNYFDLEYRSKEVTQVWNGINWINRDSHGQSTHNIPYAGFSVSVGCPEDRRQFQFRIRGQAGPSSPEGPWNYTNSHLKIFPFLSTYDSIGLFFERSEPVDASRALDVPVINEGGGTLQWQVSTNQSWLTTSSSVGTGTGTFKLTVRKPSQNLGTYPGVVTLSTTGSNPTACNQGVINFPVTATIVEQLYRYYLPVILKN